MAVTLESVVKRWVGLSTDTKPQPNADSTIPAGSSFLESDTGHIFRWNGDQWQYPEDNMNELDALRAILFRLENIDTRLALVVGGFSTQ